nr:MAG TPA: hypothetical protein [Caudoviricetes sp.]
MLIDLTRRELKVEDFATLLVHFWFTFGWRLVHVWLNFATKKAFHTHVQNALINLLT